MPATISTSPARSWTGQRERRIGGICLPYGGGNCDWRRFVSLSGFALTPTHRCKTEGISCRRLSPSPPPPLPRASLRRWPRPLATLAGRGEQGRRLRHGSSLPSRERVVRSAAYEPV